MLRCVHVTSNWLWCCPAEQKPQRASLTSSTQTGSSLTSIGHSNGPKMICCGNSPQGAKLSLGEVPLLRDFSAEQINGLRSWLEPVAWPAGHIVFRSGEPGSTLYLV